MQIFQFTDCKGFFATEINKPGSYDPETGMLLGYIHNEQGDCIGYTTVPFHKLVPAINPPVMIREIVKATISSVENELVTYLVYFDDGVKIVAQTDQENTAVIVNIPPEEVREIIAAINKAPE